MKRILVGIDGSDLGWVALAQAAELARATQASLQIAHVTEPITPLAAADFQMSAGWLEEQETWAHGLLREAVARVKSSAAEGLEVATIGKRGAPAETLAELAAAGEVTMVVVGHRGRNLAARLFVGSVADRLVQLSTRPVLVVH